MFNKKDFIYRKRSAYSQEGCDHAINFFEKRIDLQEAGTAGNELNYQWKKCTEIFLKSTEYTLFTDALNGCLRDYIKIYTHLNQLARFNLDNSIKLQKYNPGEAYFAEHCENDGPGLGYDRVLAWMIYLNDVTDGGHTNFPNQKRKFQPRRGDILIWPAYFTHTHHGMVSKTQIKYITTGWFTFNAWECKKHSDEKYNKVMGNAL